jgi:hypothetical protein
MDIERILGQQFGIEFRKRGLDDSHVCLFLLTEDDEYWHQVGNGFSSFWLDDLINQLTAAKKYMRDNCEPDKGGGFRFKP